MSVLEDYAEGIASLGVLMVVVGAGGQLTAATSQASMLFQRLNTAAMGLGLAIAVVALQYEDDGDSEDGFESATAIFGMGAAAVGLFLIAVAPFAVSPFKLTVLAGLIVFGVGVALVATFEGFDGSAREGYSVPDDPTEVLDE